MLSGLLQTAVALYPDFTLTVGTNTLTMSGFGKTFQLSLTRNAANELVVDLNGEVWTFDLMGLFTPVETLGLTFEQYMEDQMVDTYNWMTWIVIALDIAYGAAAMATGGAPLLIGLAPVTITLILASLYSLMWYYVVLPIGTAVFANNQNNFDTSEEQEKFRSDALTFLWSISKVHNGLMKIGMAALIGKSSFSKNVIDYFGKISMVEKIILAPIPSLLKYMMYIAVLDMVLGGLTTMLEPLIVNSHLNYLVIDLLLTVIGTVDKKLTVLMFILNFFGWIVYRFAYPITALF